MQKGDDPYLILDVPEDAEQSQIRKAYHRLAVKHHPDKHPEGPAREAAHHVFAKISGAYELLSEEEKRREYDCQQEEGDISEHPGFDGYAEYDYTMYPSPSSDLIPAQKNTGKPFKNPFARKKKRKPMHFNDPYEVFKRAFKDEYGYEYPGAKYDNIGPTGNSTLAKAKNAPLAIENGPATGSGGDAGGDGKKNKGILSIFTSKKKQEPSEALVVYDDNKKVKPPPGNNRPISMETKTHKVEHEDGTVETITETVITRPDGSTESSRTTDMPEKGTRDWTKPKSKPSAPQIEDGGKGKQKLLTSGKDKQKLLTSGKEKKNKPEAPLQITNGETGKSTTTVKSKKATPKSKSKK